MRNTLLTIIGLSLGMTLFGQSYMPPPATLDCATGNQPKEISLGSMQIPNVELRNQDGKKVHFYELVKGKVVAINFVFTTCTTICPPIGANFANLKARLEDYVEAEDLVMLSVSIDPVTDTPQRLKAWSEKFEAGEGWNLVTGEKAEMDALLKGLKVFTPLKEDHAPIMLIGKYGGEWLRTNALASPVELEERLRTYLPAKPTTAENSPDRNYFTDVKLINHTGEEVRLYSDLMHNKTVVINPFFLRCTGACPKMNTMMRDLERYFGDRVGRDVHLISISVDPEYDTPERVAEYAASMNAGEGRFFLTGSEENVQKALHKLGNGVKTPEDHKNVLMVGNLPTRFWKKANALAPTEEIIAIVESVLNDQGL